MVVKQSGTSARTRANKPVQADAGGANGRRERSDGESAVSSRQTTRRYARCCWAWPAVRLNTTCEGCRRPLNPPTPPTTRTWPSPSTLARLHASSSRAPHALTVLPGTSVMLSGAQRARSVRRWLPCARSPHFCRADLDSLYAVWQAPRARTRQPYGLDYTPAPARPA